MIKEFMGETYLYIADASLQASISTVVEEIHVYLDVVEEIMHDSISTWSRKLRVNLDVVEETFE